MAARERATGRGNRFVTICDKRAAAEEEQRQAVYDMYLECRTQKEIADALGISQQTVSERIGEITESSKNTDSGIFSDFEKHSDDAEKSSRQL